ncbi:Golgi-associated plant pathogenesis-related protein 1, partial [Orchesella cincta]
MTKLNFSAVAITLLAIQLTNFVQCEEIVLSDDNGSAFTLTITGGCYSLNPKWSQRATEAEVTDGCFKAYDFANCKGKAVELRKGVHDLRSLNFDKEISSVRLCTPIEEDAEQGGKAKPTPESGRSTTTGRGPGRGSSSARTERPRGGGAETEAQKAAVMEHNKYRKMHGVPDVQGDPQMHAEAQRYADYLAQSNLFEPSRTGKYDVVKRWYDKNKFYDYERPGYNIDGRNSGSFTAIVWKATTHIGLGIAWNEVEEQWIVVAFYDPPAMRSKFRENVLPP